MNNKITYAKGILTAHQYLLTKYKDVFVIGQGLWSPWYVGQTMANLDKDFGRDRVIDSPVSENAVTGAAIGASIFGYRPIVVHPRLDFMVLASDQIVNEAAKWTHMFGGQTKAAVTIRGIINRGGEQGAQHSQALHSWYAHIPGLKVVMPATANDARDLLISSVLSDDPVLYIDDRWAYDDEEEETEIVEIDLAAQGPKVKRIGSDITLIGAGYSAFQCLHVADVLKKEGISVEVIDLRVINPIKHAVMIESVKKTGRVLAVDGGWSNCGLASEILAGVVEAINPNQLKSKPQRLTLTDAPAPTSKVLEEIYYTTEEQIISRVKNILKNL
ncbi:MAG: alpha-ketoacid dehydrogenase subunit beta [Bacteroidetes bacterium]|nr:alpha-ketoacid dehydrogenase subunit beta [Bacteroidota bacterium]MBU1114857.1 alpha-ketoacid dehydrogenase subunit beta [Bacteroidota bacterium]MBU1797595.1 alpha-ketoacid dehydrogenase subunit beta [Bacteroidota bacterium]